MKRTIADSWDQITVDQYQRLEGLNIKDNLVEITSILLDAPLQEVEKYSMDTFSEILSSIGWMLKLPREDYYKKSIEIDGVEFNLIKLSELSIREWIVITNLYKDRNKNLDKIFSELYKNKDGLEGDFKKAIIADLYGVMVFFCNIEIEYYRIMQIYFQNQMKTPRKRIFCFPGMNLFTRLRRAGLWTWRKSTTAI
jgi:hypothetical protein